MFRITVAAITAMLLGSPARAGDAAPALGLTLQLTAAPVFVGEMPLLRMALTATENRQVTVLRPDFWRPTHCMVVGLIDPQGRTESFGPPPDIVFPHPLPASIQVELTRGKVINANSPAWVWPATPGKHRLVVTMWPHPEQNSELRAETVLDVLPLDDKHIMQRIGLTWKGKIREILAARDGTALGSV